MADTKISALTAASTPLDGTEVLPIVQSGATKKVANNDLRPKQIQSNATSGVLQIAGPAAATTRVMTVPNSNFTAARTDAGQTFTGNNTFNGTTTVSAAEAYLALDAATLGAGKLWYLISGGGGNITPGYLSFFNGTNGVSVWTLAPSTTQDFVSTATGDLQFRTGNLVIGTSGKGITDSTGATSLNFSSTGTTLSGTQQTSTGVFNNVGTAQTIAIASGQAGFIVITGVQGGVGASSWNVPFVNRLGTTAVSTAPTKAVVTADPITSVTASGANIVITPLAANTYISYAIYYTPCAI